MNNPVIITLPYIHTEKAFPQATIFNYVMVTFQPHSGIHLVKRIAGMLDNHIF